MLAHKKTTLIPLILTLISLLLAGCNSQKQNQNVHNNQSLKSISGQQYSLNKLQDKWVIINYWASWCQPCYQEIPELNKFYQHHKNSVMVFGVSYDQVGPGELKQIIANLGIEFPTLLTDPKNQLGIKNIHGLPATLVINPKGKLVKVLYGIQTEKSLAKVTGLESKGLNK